MTVNPRQKIILIGSSGHASVLADAIERDGSYTIDGYLDDELERGVVCRNAQVLGKLTDASRICEERSISSAAIAVGDNWQRRRIYLDLRQLPGLNFPVIRHPTAVVAASAQIGEGTVLLARCHVGPNSTIGKCCILNTGSSVDHDSTLGDFSSFAPGVFAGGKVNIGACSAIGVGASIRDRITIGEHSIVGVGSVVVRDLPGLVVAYGSPATVRRARTPGEPYLSGPI